MAPRSGCAKREKEIKDNSLASIPRVQLGCYQHHIKEIRISASSLSNNGAVLFSWLLRIGMLCHFHHFACKLCNLDRVMLSIGTHALSRKITTSAYPRAI